MNSQNSNFEELEKKDTENITEKQQSLTFELTTEQYLYIQHHLPKSFALVDQKSVKRQKKETSLKSHDPQNLSLISGNDGQDLRTKRERSKMKKTDRYLEEDLPRQNKRQNSDKLIQLSEELKHCEKILNLLKKHPNAVPFLQPVNPKTSGALNYYDVVTEPMDLWTIQKNLKEGSYNRDEQFHEDIEKIWRNSYTYNQKNSKMYKVTIEMEQYYNKIKQDVNLKVVTKEEKIRKKNTGEKTVNKKTFYQRLKRLPEMAVSQLMSMLSQTGKYPKNKIQLDFDQYDVTTLQQIDEFIKAVETKYRVNERKTFENSEYHDSNSIV